MKKMMMTLVAVIVVLGMASSVQAESHMHFCKRMGYTQTQCSQAMPQFATGPCRVIDAFNGAANGFCTKKLRSLMASQASKASTGGSSRQQSSSPRLRRLTRLLGHNPQSARCKSGKCFTMVPHSDKQLCIWGTFGLRQSNHKLTRTNLQEYHQCMENAIDRAKQACDERIEYIKKHPVIKRLLEKTQIYQEGLGKKLVAWQRCYADKHDYSNNLGLSSKRCAHIRPHTRANLRGTGVQWIGSRYTEGKDIVRRQVDTRVACSVTGLTDLSLALGTALDGEINRAGGKFKRQLQRLKRDLLKRMKKLGGNKNFVTNKKFNAELGPIKLLLNKIWGIIKNLKPQVVVEFSIGYSGMGSFWYNSPLAPRLDIPAALTTRIGLLIMLDPLGDQNNYLAADMSFNPIPLPMKVGSGFSWMAGIGYLYRIAKNVLLGPMLRWKENALVFVPEFGAASYHGPSAMLRMRWQIYKLLVLDLETGPGLGFYRQYMQAQFEGRAMLGICNW